jgi:predicted MFS family arabinose efflux permease
VGAVMPAPRLARALRPEWSSRNFRLVFAARVSMSASRALAGVLAPIYLALEGFSALRLGELLLAVALTSAVMSSTIGLVSDAVGRRPFLVAIPLLAAGAGAVFAFSRSVPLLFLAAALGTYGRGTGAGAGAVGPYQPAESAFVTESVPASARNSAFGRLAFGSSLGSLAGGLLALLAGNGHAHGAHATALFRGAFLVTAALAAASGLLALGLVEARPARRPSAGGGRARRRPRLPRRSRPLLYRLWVTNSLNGAAIGMFGAFVTYWFFRRFHVGPGEVGVLYAVVNAATMGSTLTAASIARRFGLVRTVAAVRTLQALLIVPMVLVPSFFAAGAIYLVRMVVQRVGLPLRQSYVLAMADPRERAAVAALSNLPSQLTMAASPVFAGYLFDEVSLSLPFEIAAVLQLANAFAYWVFFHDHPPEEEREPVSPDAEVLGDAAEATTLAEPAGKGAAGDGPPPVTVPPEGSEGEGFEGEGGAAWVTGLRRRDAPRPAAPDA